jgi:hypothetical protein
MGRGVGGKSPFGTHDERVISEVASTAEVLSYWPSSWSHSSAWLPSAR